MKNIIKSTSVIALIIMLSGCIVTPPHHRGGYDRGYHGGGYYDRGWHGDWHRGGPYRGW